MKKAKESGMFSQEEADSWRGHRHHEEEEVVEDTPTEEKLGPIAAWVKEGMPMEKPLKELGLEEELPPEAPSAVPEISVHTIHLPERAPRQLLLEVKSIFETFKGSEKVQLSIGEKIVPVSLTITFSPLLEKRIEEAVKKYAS